MRTVQRQKGASLLGMLVIAVMVGFFVLCAIRMIPPYLEYLSVREVLDQVAAEYDPGEDTVGDIRARISKLFNTNQIYGLKPQEVEVYRDGGQTHIDGRYEARVPIAGQIDAVIRFEDLEFVAGRDPKQ